MKEEMSMLEPKNNKKKSVNGVKKIAGEHFMPLALKGMGALALIAMGALAVIWGVRSNPQWFGFVPNGDTRLEEQQRELERYLDEVSQIMLLPDEVPSLATVEDVEAAKANSPSFYANTEKGDIVLIFQNAQKAILYRPGEKKIIEVGVIRIEEGREEGQEEIEIEEQ